MMNLGNNVWVSNGKSIVGPSQDDQSHPSSQLTAPSRISNSDFYDLGNEICLIGVGQGTNTEAVVECMSKQYLHHNYIAVVKDCFDWNPSRKHLSDICRIVSLNKAIVLESVANATRHRLVDVFKKTHSTYELWLNSVDFVDFLKLNLQFQVEIQPELNEPHIAIQLPSDRCKFPEVPTAWPTTSPSVQTTNTVLMVSPMNFCYNIETAQDNSFMKTLEISAEQLKYKVLEEFSNLVNALTNEGVNVHVVLNDTPGTPDAVFPNNWFSTHCTANNKRALCLYSMKSESRRKERNPVIIKRLEQHYPEVSKYVDCELNSQVLEGTGALVLDHMNKIAYVVESQRADREVAEQWAKNMGYSLVLFKAVDESGKPIYHTNVVMSVGTKVAILCEECIPDVEQRENVVNTLKKTHEIVTISYAQMNNFAGNALELLGKNGLVLLLSKTAFDALSPSHKNVFERNGVKLVPSDIHVLETIGGFIVRCCIAQLF